jgi:hypothetical protein
LDLQTCSMILRLAKAKFLHQEMRAFLFEIGEYYRYIHSEAAPPVCYLVNQIKF